MYGTKLNIDNFYFEGEMQMLTPKLETERLILRQIKNEDVDTIYNCWMQDEDVSRYMYWKASKDINEAQKFVQFELGNLNSDKWYRWIILLKQTDEIIGTCLIYYNDEENNWDISYNLGKVYWGNGYITEAMHRVMEYAINEITIKECIAIHAIENPESGRVIQNLGFEYEKEVPYECNGGEIKTVGKYYKFVAR